MTTDDPFRRLGLGDGASAEEVRAARRRLAKELHPDRGGPSEQMQRVNDAADAALRVLADPNRRRDEQSTDPNAGTSHGTRTEPSAGREDRQRVEHREEHHGDPRYAVHVDAPSFTVEALPAETFEALLVATGALGAVTDEDPPYRLDVRLDGAPPIWCRLEVVPEAGASAVSIAAALPRRGRVHIEDVRDRWIAALNDLDWDQLSG